MDFDKRFLDIVEKLNESKEFITSAELSNALGVSTKTISRNIQKYNKDEMIEKYGFSITTKQGQGYKLEIKDYAKFQQFLNMNMETSQHRSAPNGEVNREYEIINLLLLHDDFITIAKIADQLYVSDATVSADLKNIRHLLQRYGVRIENRSSKGIRIAGNEMSLRLCISKYVYFQNHQFSNNTLFENADELEKLNVIVFEILNKYRIHMSDASREHLISHIFISIQRMKLGHFIVFDDNEKEKITAKREYVIAKEMVSAICKEIKIDDIDGEVIYIAIQLLGKRSFENNSEQYQLSEDIEFTLKKIFTEIHGKLGIDLTSDIEVFNYLAMHFEPMFIRLKYGIKSSNPLLDEVKTRQTTSFEMGLIAKRVISDSFAYQLDDTEVSFLAMYFSLALERLQSIQIPKRVLVVCGLGVCSSRILVFKLHQRYEKYISEVVTAQYHELVKYDLSKFDCIISTIDKEIKTELPTIFIDDFLSDINDKELDAFFFNGSHQQFNLNSYLCKDYFMLADTMKNEEEAIDYILNNLSQYTDIPKELKANIMEREALSSTAYGNYCALPHPMKMCTEENIFAVLFLNKGMKWGKKKVKCVFFLSPSKNKPSDLRKFNESLASFILNPDLFNKFMKNPTYETLHDVLSIIE